MAKVGHNIKHWTDKIGITSSIFQSYKRTSILFIVVMIVIYADIFL